MKKLISFVTMGVVLGSAAVFADPDSSRVPLERAEEALKANIVKNPDARGLPNAFDRVLENARRHETKGKNQPPGKQQPGPSSATGGNAERTEVVDRVENTERPDRVERIDRPELPAHPVHPDHPTHPGRP